MIERYFIEVVDILDEKSPFWKMSAEDFLTERFEIVVFLEGTVESTGMCTQVRPKNIFWGRGALNIAGKGGGGVRCNSLNYLQEVDYPEVIAC